MTTETRNEAAERLNIQVRAMTDTLEAYAAGRLGWDGFQETIGAAFAAERRATVERIRAALLDIGDEDGFTTTGRVRRILDEEAAR